MDAITFPRSALYPHLTILIFILLSMSIITSACDNSTQSNYQNATNSTQTNHQNITTTPSSYNQTYYKTYIKTACNTTTYPSICYRYLYPYALQIEADPMKLCNTSLSLALKAARSASSTISNILKSNNLTHTAEEVVHDCFDNLKESIGEMQDSLDDLGHLYDSTDKDFEMSNIKTWVSAAITDDETCSDGFDEEKVDATVRDKIRKIVLNVARMTSNALYFINNLSYK